MQNPRTAGSRSKAKYVGLKEDIVAGSGTDNSKVTGEEVDRLVSGALARSAKLVIPYNFTLASGETASFTVGLTDCATTGGSYSSAVSLLAKTAVATGAAGGSTAVGVVEIDTDLSARAEFLKYEITADLSASGTDAGDYHAAVVLSGFDVES